VDQVSRCHTISPGRPPQTPHTPARSSRSRWSSRPRCSSQSSPATLGGTKRKVTTRQAHRHPRVDVWRWRSRTFDKQLGGALLVSRGDGVGGVVHHAAVVDDHDPLGSLVLKDVPGQQSRGGLTLWELTGGSPHSLGYLLTQGSI